MNDKGNSPAQAQQGIIEYSQYDGTTYREAKEYIGGYTKREDMLIRFMEAMLSNPNMVYEAKDMVQDALAYVDAALEYMEK